MSFVTNEVFFNAQEAANYVRRPYKTLEGWRKKKNPKLKHIKDGGEIKYRKSDCDEYLNNQLRL